VYYLTIIKQIFFYRSDFTINPELDNCDWDVIHSDEIVEMPDLTKIRYIIVRTEDNAWSWTNLIKIENIVTSSSLILPISIITLIMLLFILVPQEWLRVANILAIILFNI
jgi:NADH-ubiquinone oxidoreductase chain 2